MTVIISRMLRLSDITYRIEGRALLEGASATIPSGHKVGLVGRNGTGKTTLLNIISGFIQPDDGSISIPNGWSIGRLNQEAPDGPESLLETVLSFDEERSSLIEESETATDPQRIADIQLRLDDIDAHSAPARAASILAGLGFSEDDQQQPCSSYSGGWRMRVALAGLLFTQPDILLLDEPTNYLDLEGTIWLKSYLRTYPNTILIVSHDRTLLNSSVQSILHLNDHTLTLFSGGYDRFERTRAEQQELLAKLKVKRDAQRQHMEKFVERFRYKASKARQAQSRIKALAKLQPISAVVDSQVRPITLPQPDMLAPPIMSLESVVTGYDPGTPILSKLNFRIDMDDRIALLGKNGNGKSTLAKLLAGRLNAFEGQVVKDRKLKVGYFAQHQLDELDESGTPLSELSNILPDKTVGELRSKLGAMGFGAEKIGTAIKSLSGGERARLLLGLATIHTPHLIILDEPTNHLDVDTRESLIHALNDFTGAVILISHDIHLIETCVDRLWLVEDGTVQPYQEDLTAYQKFVTRKDKPEVAEKNQKATPVDKKEARRSMARQRADAAPLKKEVQTLEREMAKLEKKIARIDDELSDENLYNDDPQRVKELTMQRGQLQKTLERTETKWLERQEQYDKALNQSIPSNAET